MMGVWGTACWRPWDAGKPAGNPRGEAAGTAKERMAMQSRVTEIAKETYQISTFHPDYGIQFNQFLIKDDQPFLWHTGFKRMFQTTLAGVASLIDPAALHWVGFSHFESDECGALNEWLEVAPRAQAVCSFVGARVMVSDFADRGATTSFCKRAGAGFAFWPPRTCPTAGTRVCCSTKPNACFSARICSSIRAIQSP
jgi:hypothetical protein